MTMIRWEPLREMMSLRDAMDRLFEDSVVRTNRNWPEVKMVQLPLDIYQTKNDVVIKAALPGLKAEDVDISITGDTLTIKGEYKDNEEVKEEDYLYREYRSGTFVRSATIPVGIKEDKAEAKFENGVLTITIPKAEEVKAKPIKIKTTSTGEAKQIKEAKK